MLSFLSDKALNETLERVLQSGYFDRVQSHQNGVCAEEEEQTAAVEVSEAEEHPPDAGKSRFMLLSRVTFILKPLRSRLISERLTFMSPNRG